MTNESRRGAELVQLRFRDESDDVHDLNAAELAEVLQGLAELSGEWARAGVFGDGPPPELRVRPAEPGSFVLTTILQWSMENPEIAVASGTSIVGGFGYAIRQAIKRFTTEQEDFEFLDNGMVKVKWTNGTAEQVPRALWDQLQRAPKKTKRSLGKLMRPLGDDVSQLEIRQGQSDDDTQTVLSTEPVIVGDRTDYRIVASESSDETESVETHDLEAQLRSVDFRPGQKWRVQTTIGTRLATIEDEEFLARLDRGMALHKNDLFEIRLRVQSVTRDERTTSEWFVERVTRKRRGDSDDTSSS